MVDFYSALARKIQQVQDDPARMREVVYEAAANFIEDTAGKDYGRKFFPVCMTIFLFVLVNAWLSLVPGFETIRYHGQPVFRNANTDINVPLMLAIVSFLFVEYWGFKAHGLPYLRKFFNIRPLMRGIAQLITGKVRSGLGGITMGAITVFTGLLEIMSELIRIVSFTFRLFGNMTAGMVLTLMMIYLIPWAAPSIFYGLEAFLGFVQAVIFGGLTLCFLVIAVMPHEEEEGEEPG